MRTLGNARRLFAIEVPTVKIIESGMPDKKSWEDLFNVRLILDRFGMDQFVDVAELGCGYGTFSVAAAERIRGTLYAFDIDAEMLAHTQARGAVADGFGVRVDAVMLFNVLHGEQPLTMLRHAAATGDTILVVHWRHGDTPRGPSLDIRPSAEQIIDWACKVGLELVGDVMDLPPWHFGMRLVRANNWG